MSHATAGSLFCIGHRRLRKRAMSFSRSKFSLALRSSTAAVCTALASRSLLDFESCSRCSASATDEVKPQASEEDQPNSNESTSRKRARGNQLYSCEDLNDLKWRVSYKNRRYGFIDHFFSTCSVQYPSYTRLLEATTTTLRSPWQCTMLTNTCTVPKNTYDRI